MPNRARDWFAQAERDLSGLPLQAELLVYTADEWRDLEASESRFGSMLLRATVSVR